MMNQIKINMWTNKQTNKQDAGHEPKRNAPYALVIVTWGHRKMIFLEDIILDLP